jgi:hypothetical protein
MGDAVSDSRKTFEAEYRGRYQVSPGHYNGIHYEDERTQTLWAWWQAARASHHCKGCDGHDIDGQVQP